MKEGILIMDFSLVSNPWIRVYTKSDALKTVSLKTIMTNTAEFQSLAGESAPQNVPTLRFLLAILLTVYSRVDTENNPYSWLNNLTQYNKNDLYATWYKLYERGKFGQEVIEYLNQHEAQLTISDHDNFLTVSHDTYNTLSNKQIESGSGKVPLHTLDRTISESGNKHTIFSNRTDSYKENLSTDSLVRWLLAYQNFAGISEKSVLKNYPKYGGNSGWLAQFKPLFVKGCNLFETLMLNLVLVTDDTYHVQKPLWEQDFKTFIETSFEHTSTVKLGSRSPKFQTQAPDNLAGLYTWPVRMLYCSGREVYATKLLGINPLSPGAQADPMCQWYQTKKKDIVPKNVLLSDLDRALWRDFGLYVGVSDNITLGTIKWLNQLYDHDYLSDPTVHLATAAWVYDPGDTAQLPQASVCDDFWLPTTVLNSVQLQGEIETVIQNTQQVGQSLYHFGKALDARRKLENIASRDITTYFYATINSDFKNWITMVNDKNYLDQVKTWYHKIEKLGKHIIDDFLQKGSPRDLVRIVTNTKNKATTVFDDRRLALNTIHRTLFGKQVKK